MTDKTTTNIEADANHSEQEPVDQHLDQDQRTKAEGQDVDTSEENTADSEHHNPRLTAARKDAAKYRERLREAESNLEASHARVAGLEHAVIEMANPIAHNVSTAALVKLGLNITDFISDSGEVDLAGIKQACINIAKDAGINTAPESNLPIVESVGRTGSTSSSFAGNWIGRALDGQ